ncbi:MAG: hypothetical protein M3490_12320 [Chloroflexota bacterium]|nr:hypothetical protein [Chloroflexota bacterium]
MVINQETHTPEFAGTKKNQALAGKAFEILRSRGMFMSDYSPIRVPAEVLTAFLVEQEDVKASDVAKAIAENPNVFATATVDDTDYVLTTRTGKAPVSNDAASTHSFSARFMTPEPKPIRPPRPAPVRVRVDPNWATYSVPEFVDYDEDAYLDFPEEDETDEVVVIAEPEIVAEPAAPAIVAPDAVVAETPVVADEPVEAAAAIEPEHVEPLPAVAAEAEVVAPVVEPVTEEVPAVAEVAPPVAEPAPAVTQPVTDPVRAGQDFSGTDEAALAAAIEAQLAEDTRIASFAGQWMPEDRVARLGRNDIRRIKEYITEQEQPLTDGTLAQDILNVRPNSADFASIQFAVNFRLSREHRDFDFVGTNDQRFWSTSSLPQIGTTRRKPNEIGTDYRYLIDEAAEPVESRSVSSVSHVLSFYEFTLGLLPYDVDMQRLMPKQVLPEQRSAVLTFEIPQLYTTYLVELRYPTPNRGGFLLGLDDFYAESLVPGAMISITATESDGHYKIEFLQSGNQNARLLDLDDRRSPRYHFRPTSFACEVDPDWLISEDRFPKLGNEKPLDDKIRRRPDAVVEATFERIGLEDGSTFISTFEELLGAANIERPFSEHLLRTTLDQHAKVSSDDGDTFTYDAG